MNIQIFWLALYIFRRTFWNILNTFVGNHCSLSRLVNAVFYIWPLFLQYYMAYWRYLMLKCRIFSVKKWCKSFQAFCDALQIDVQGEAIFVFQWSLNFRDSGFSRNTWKSWYNYYPLRYVLCIVYIWILFVKSQNSVIINNFI